MDTKEEFGKRLSQALDGIDFPTMNHGRTVELGKLMDVTERTVSNWLSGIKLPQIDKMMALAKLTKVSFHWLALGEGPMYPETLSDDEKALLTRYRALSTDDKSKVPGILAVFEARPQDRQAA